MSKATKIALLDYGMGNLHSASKALAAVGAEVSITNDPKVVAAADKIFFPGVGAMRAWLRHFLQRAKPHNDHVMSYISRETSCNGLPLLVGQRDKDDENSR